MLAVFAGSALFAEEEPSAEEPVAEAEEIVPQIVDSDGDLVPDDADPLPFIANAPVYWAVQKLTAERTSATPPLSDSWKDSFSLVLSYVPSPVPLEKPLTAQPLVSRKATGKVKGHPFSALGLCGSGTLPWGDLQRARAVQFLEGFRQDREFPLTLRFTVSFTGLDAPRTFADIAVPVTLGGKKYADAVPVGGERNLVTPSAGKTVDVDFIAEIPARNAEGFLSRLAKGDEAPLFDFERAVDADLDLRNLFESISQKTVEVSVAEPAGLVWRWRVARNGEMTFGDWAAEMNNRFIEVYGLPFAAFAVDYPVSVCGWDTGALGQWWAAKSGKSAVDAGELCALRLSSPVALSLSPARPRDLVEEDFAIVTNQLAAAGVVFADGYASSAYPDCLLKAVDAKKDARAREAALSTAAWHGGAEAWAQMGVFLLDTANSHAGLDWLELAASHGSVPAYARLAGVYQKGEFDCEKNGKTAAAYLQKAADGGDVPSMVALAEKYRAGEGLRKNDKAAAKYFAQAAEAGNLDAQTWYALSLLEGAGVRKDPEAGMAWLRSAAEADHDIAQYLLAVFLFAGYDGVEKNQGEAFALFASAAKTQKPAKVFLGYCHLNGLGTAKDEKAAAACFREAADADVPAGLIWLAYCYANGLGVEKNVETARTWAKKAADAGYPAGRQMLLSIQE